MALVKLMAGTVVDIPTQDELGRHVDAAVAGASAAFEESLRQREQVRGIKWMRLPPVLQGKPSGGALAIGNPYGQTVGPRLGYAWSLRRLIVDGLTAAATPDVVNLYLDSSTGRAPMWQFNGNNFGYSFNSLEMVMLGGETLTLTSVGTFSATGVIRLSGEMIELPQEMLAKLAVAVA